MPSDNVELRRQLDGRLAGLRSNRYSWWTHWRELAEFVLPRRYKWLVTPNFQSRGSPINQSILDSTGTLAARNLASGMMSGITSPARPWFKLRIGRIDSTQTSPISLWLSECERLLLLIFQESNFYNSMAVMYFDLVVFGTAPILIYEDFDNVIQCFNPCAGEYFVENSPKYRVDTFYREFVLTISQIVAEFGEENCSTDVRQAYKTGMAATSREKLIGHAIEPNDDKRGMGIPSSFRYREVYWELGSGTEFILRKRGFYESPAVVPRWDLVSNDSYGRSPAMDALGDIKQLQQETKRKAQAIDKLVNPPMVADIQLKNQPASLLPGGVTYIAGMAQGKVGFAPVYTVAPPVKEILEDLNEVRERIKTIFFNNLFQMISQFEPKSGITATEIDARRSEQLIMLGPVLERVENEGIKPAVERVFAIAQRAGILPDAPREIQGLPMEIEFVSMLEAAQAASETSGIERLFQVAGNVGAIDPQAYDNIDIDYGLEKYSHLLNNDPKLIRSPKQLAAIRQQRQQQQQAQQQMEQSLAAVKGAEVLSKTSVGGGKNALQQMSGL